MPRCPFCVEGIEVLQPIYEIRHLKHCYGSQTVLSVDHLAIRPASIVGLLGPNGSGKSTLLRLLGLIEKPTQGEVRFDGRPVEPFSEAARFEVTMLPQEPFLMKRSVYRNVAYGLKLRGLTQDIPARVHEALALVGLNGDQFINRPWYALSGGEAQRVALAARLALKPKVLLLDEPTASVDAASAQLIREASLQARQELDTTLIVASHDWQWIYEICDEVLHLFKGRVFGIGHENIVFGPWSEITPGVWGKSFTDHQHLITPRPPNKDMAAIIQRISISTSGEPKDDDKQVLRGTVTRLNLAKHTGQLIATILVGDQAFTVQQDLEPAKKQDLFPGRTIYMRYKPSEIKWI
jgi:tungstate transport system ATP-binding protein